jgi:hypothetical protein
MGLRTVTHDLLARFSPPAGGSASGPNDLMVTYARVPDHSGADPRAAVLRPSAGWLLSPGRSLGAGRAPTGVDVTVPLLEDDGVADRTVPRLAVRLAFSDGVWSVSNHASGAATVLITAPGSYDELGARGPAYVLRRRRLTLSVRARCMQGGHPTAVEHRLTVFAPWIPDDAPEAPEMEVRPTGGVGLPGRTGPADPGDFAAKAGPVNAAGAASTVDAYGPDDVDAAYDAPTAETVRTTDLARGLRWTWAQQRLLAAWAYPELIGLPPRSQPRDRITRLLLRQGMDGRDPNERILSRLRRKASDELGVPLTGEANTPAFLGYVVNRRGYLGDALAALHAEYDATHRIAALPPEPAPASPR